MVCRHQTSTPPHPPDRDPTAASGNESGSRAERGRDSTSRTSPSSTRRAACPGPARREPDDRPGKLVGIVGPLGPEDHPAATDGYPRPARPPAGVRITGLDVAATGRRRGRRYLSGHRIGFIFQQFFLAEHATVLDNVADGLLDAGASPANERRRQALDALEPGRPGPSAQRSAHRTLGRATATRRDRRSPRRRARRSCSPTSRRATSTRSPAMPSWR